MLEGLVTWVLNTYLGEYVENLNTDQLSIAMLHGAVELENLTLKKDALRPLDLPIEVKSGVIGKVSLQIPITLLRTEKWVICMEKLYLVAGPLTSTSQYNEDKERANAQAKKDAMLKALEKQWKIDSKEISSKSSWFSFGSSMTANIVENLQVIVKDVHIRYENDQFCPSGPIACGVKISSLSAQSTDMSWVPTFILNRTGDMAHKLVDLQGFSVYCDTAATLVDCTTEQSLMMCMDNDSDTNIQNHEYILGPVTAQAKMRRNTSQLNLLSSDSPRVTFDVSMDRIPVALSDAQYHRLVFLAKQVDYHNTRRGYRKYRPPVSSKRNARSLWQFAIRCHLAPIQELNKRRTKEFVLRRVNDIVAYHHAYYTELVNTYVDINLKMVMSKIEEDLTFSELKILRELAFNKASADGQLKTIPSVPTPANNGAGLFQSWFPGWAGWYSSPSSTSVDEPVPPEMPEPSELQIEKDIMEVLSDFAESDTLLKRDLVFAVVNFSLNSGSFRLNTTGSNTALPHHSTALLEVECTTITMRLESRPRTSAMQLSLSLGGLYVRDKVTPDTLFPNIVAPQHKCRASFMTDHIQPSLSQTVPRNLVQDDPTFTFSFELRPANLKANYRLIIKMKPLDIIYNSNIVCTIRDFFTKHIEQTTQDSDIPSSAQSRLESLKQQTKNELKNTIDRLLEGNDEIRRNQWDIHLDIAAPQIIIPEDFQSPDTPLVIFDLGHLTFHSGTVARSNDQANPRDITAEDDDEEFQTPRSTPPGELHDSKVQVADRNDGPAEISKTEMFECLYDRYTLNLMDVQVKVCRARDNWRQTGARSSSHMHAVDKFSISLLFERRLVFSTDPQLPSAMLSGNINNLTLHLDEQKMKLLKTCIDGLHQSDPKPETDENVSLLDDSDDVAKCEGTTSPSAPSHGRELQSESRLLVVQFAINETSLQIHSRGLSLAELRVGGMETTFTKFPHATSANFSIHSLLIVDAIQTFGPDFELLVASHKNVSLDKTSGSMCDSEPTSPSSPQSPIGSPIPFTNAPSQQTMFSAVSFPTSQFTSDKTTGRSSRPTPDIESRRPELTRDQEALISIDVVSPDPPTSLSGNCGIRTANIKFNNLDVIANQYTVMELMAFFTRVIPLAHSSRPQASIPTASAPQATEPSAIVHTDVTAEFRNLNILLLRIINDTTGKKEARKVAMATMSSANIHATLGDKLVVEGSIGGLELRDVTPEDSIHKSIVSVGVLHPDSLSDKARTPSTMYQTAYEGFYPVIKPIAEETKAFSCTVIKSNDTPSLMSNDRDFNVSLHTASVCYTHSPRFLREFGQCVSEFQGYIKKVSTSLKHAATEVAKGIVSKRSDVMPPFYGSTGSLDSLHTTSAHEMSFNDSAIFEQKLCITVSAAFDSPVIVLPRTADSNEALVAHLGKIYVRNTAFDETGVQYSAADFSFCINESDKIYIDVRNMNLYSVDLAKRDVKMKSFSCLDNCNVHPYIQCQSQTPIVYDTNIEFTIETNEPPVINLDDIQDMWFNEPKSSVQTEMSNTVVSINMKIATPLKLVITKNIYEQILQTTDNVTYDERRDANVSSSMKTSATSMADTSDILSQNVDKTRENTPTEKGKSSNLTLKLKFDVPEVDIEMRGEFGEGEQGLVDLRLTNFSMDFEKSNSFSTKVKVALHGLTMEDLLQNSESEHRFIMVSSTKARVTPCVTTMSSSCPISSIVMPIANMPPSLPTTLVDIQNVFSSHHRALDPIRPDFTRRKMRHEESSCPGTPPPSPCLSRCDSHSSSMADDALVEISIVIIDKNSPEYHTEFNRTNRYIDVKFNSLDTTINLQTWVVLLDFVGMGAKIHDADVLTGTSQTTINETSTSSDSTEEFVNSKVDLSVQNLSLTFNKPKYELSRFNVTRFTTRINARDGDIAASAQLGALSLLDQSPTGSLYRHKFITIGEQALDFEMYKYGMPDPHLQRPFDLRIKLRMASVRYTHSQRFHMELLAFCQNFLKLQDVLGRQRAASAGKKLTETAMRGARVSLDIEADSPIILIPENSRSSNVLVMDLGHFTVTNEFIFDGNLGTIKHGKSLLSTPTDETVKKPPIKANNSNDTMFKMTQSIFDEFLPPREDYDPMTDSVYGDLNHDLRANSPDDIFPLNRDTENSSSIHIDESIFPNVSGNRHEFYLKKMQQDFDLHPNLSYTNVFDKNYITNAIGSSVDGDLDVLKRPSLSDTLLSYPSLSSSSNTFPPSIPSFTTSQSPQTCHICLLDVIHIALSDINLYSATRFNHGVLNDTHKSDLTFPSCVIARRQEKHRILKEKCVLDLQVERNLEGDISHDVPDFNVSGSLSSAVFKLDLSQYKVIRGILDHNLGEPLEDFQTPLLTHLQNPEIQTVLTGEVWKVVSISFDLSNVTVELLTSHADEDQSEASLARLDFLKSHIMYESHSNQSKDIELTSREILISDTRYQDAPANARPSVFSHVLQPSKSPHSTFPVQLQLHFRSTQTSKTFTILLNNMRLFCVFDWLVSLQEFLLTNADSPLPRESHGAVRVSPHREVRRSVSDSTVMSHPQRSPLTCYSGVITKRGPIIHKVDVPFELKLNVSDTEFVVVEDVSKWDSNAIILRCTAVLLYKPLSPDKPLSCSLQRLEVFSCSLSSEEDTALSILDPMQVTADLNANRPISFSRSASAGLLDAKPDAGRALELEVTFTTMSVRLSYHDMMLFYAILQSLPTQGSPHASPSMFSGDLAQLRDLGYCNDDCKRALQESGGRYDDAARWLSRHAVALPSKVELQKTDLSITSVEVKAESVHLVIIDDCKDTDVPLIEISLSESQEPLIAEVCDLAGIVLGLVSRFVHGIAIAAKGGISLSHTLKPAMVGKATFQISGDYYNRALSGWEPFLEPWRCDVAWRESNDDGVSRLAVDVEAPEIFNVNVTSPLLDLYTKTKVLWMEDYTAGQRQCDGLSGQQRRVQFIPFSLRNQTGSSLHFLTMTTSPGCVNKTKYNADGSDAYIESSAWIKVESGQDVPFFIQGREKMRHKKSHELHIHQLKVRVQGWQYTSPVSVDKVGVYFRYVRPESISPSSTGTLNATRIVFEVRQEGNARKLVIVRSALVVLNKLDSPLDIAIKHKSSGQQMLNVAPKSSLPIPMMHLASQLWIRPSDWSVKFCNEPINWTKVTKGGEICDETRVCQLKGDIHVYRLCVSTKREMYPDDIQLTSGQTPFHIPGHVITVTSPVVLVNLLPVDLFYEINSHQSSSHQISGSVSSSNELSIHSVDLCQNLELSITIDNFPRCKSFVIPSGTTDFCGTMRLFDTTHRPLELGVRIAARRGGSLKVFISAPYWLINRCGFPLVFKQDQTVASAAGQSNEHEEARSIEPLLFSYTDNDYSLMCSMKVGKGLHGQSGTPYWSSGFSLESGESVRQLHIVPNKTNAPDWVYNIGIEVKKGRGRYRDTKFVTFAPRYRVDNRSRHSVLVSQKHFTTSSAIPSLASAPLQALPKSKIAFHWPRVDLDQLMCVSVRERDGSMTSWSGGFVIDRVSSFYANMRHANGSCLLLKVEVILLRSTFLVVFIDAEELPPPYRIENFSEVSVVFQQDLVDDKKLEIVTHAQTSVNYSWDEPTLPPRIGLGVYGSAGNKTVYDLNQLGEGKPLHYENFIYIAADMTFRKPSRRWESDYSCQDLSGRNLVLDVKTCRVIYSQRQEGKRSQLWRLSPSGLLIHEASTPPLNPDQNPDSLTGTEMVLDIHDIAPQPGLCNVLELKMMNRRRRSTQTWTFSPNGRLCCGLDNLCVQPIEGVAFLKDGGVACLGPITDVDRVPDHMRMSPQALQRGSGCLSVQVVMDGPTRCLRIVDAQQRKLIKKTVSVDETTEGWEMYERLPQSHSSCKNEVQKPRSKTHLSLSLRLSHGVGVSLVNHVPEELAYISLRDLGLDYSSYPQLSKLNLSIGNIQIDNNLFGTQCPVIVFVTPVSRSDAKITGNVALHVNVHKIPNTKWNAQIFKHFVVTMKMMTIQLEERWMWKLIQFAGYKHQDTGLEQTEDAQKLETGGISPDLMRYYFSKLRLDINRVTLSMLTSKLSSDLKAIKESLSVRLLQFEDARVDLDPFERRDVFETREFVMNEVMHHYRKELNSQAAKIFGSVDFLGNPLGLFNDVADGISGLIKDGNVSGLLKNITHGTSNWAAKVAGTLSDGFGTAGMDERHNARREHIKEKYSSSSSGQLVAGFKGLSFGIYGGLTSLITQPYRGIKDSGLPGFVKGVGKGAVGTITKPVSGVLDLASGAAAAVSNKSSSHYQPKRVRPTRCCKGSGSLMPPYDRSQADGQTFLYKLNSNRFTEFFIADEYLRTSRRSDSYHVLITSRHVYVLRPGQPDPNNIVLKVTLHDLLRCHAINKQIDGVWVHYLEIVMIIPPDSPYRQPQFRCDNEQISQRVMQQINFAKNMHDERRQTLISDKTLDID